MQVALQRGRFADGRYWGEVEVWSLESRMNVKVLLVALIFAMIITNAAAAGPAHRHRQKVQPEAHIACTVLGCIPVPPSCGQTYGRTRNGTPTGYDVIVCPPGVWPLK
jgi:hypothetical protein